MVQQAVPDLVIAEIEAMIGAMPEKTAAARCPQMACQHGWGTVRHKRDSATARPVCRGCQCELRFWAAYRERSAMYAAIRQGRRRPVRPRSTARRIKEGAIPIISDVEGFMGYYVVYAPDDTVSRDQPLQQLCSGRIQQTGAGVD